jgi:hypothetical protein
MDDQDRGLVDAEGRERQGILGSAAMAVGHAKDLPERFAVLARSQVTVEVPPHSTEARFSKILAL